MSFSVRTTFGFCLGLILLTFVVLWRITGNGFVNYDDVQYIIGNRHVTAGLTAENATWAFTSTYASNWHPLTWLSHMADVEMFGLNPYKHHLTSLLLHTANTCLLFLLLTGLTRMKWRSVMVAALFAIHPLHVESVAWVAERKDLLAAFFGLLTLLAYTRYVQLSRMALYFTALGCFMLGLLSKPMLVSLPFLLLLLDYWPLCRCHCKVMAIGDSQRQNRRNKPLLRLALEKLPFFVLSGLSCVITIYAQRSGDSIASLADKPLPYRLANAMFAYVRYIGKTCWPHDLAAFYPLPKSFPLWQSVGSGVVLLVILLLALAMRRRYPYFIVGWLWFIGSLVPVIGLVQVGLQSMADRYTYLPLIGIFIIVVWGVSDLAEEWFGRTAIPASAATAIIMTCCVISWQQVCYWHSSRSLASRMTATNDSFMAHYLLGSAALDEGKTAEAVAENTLSLAANPGFAEAYFNLGIALGSQGRLDEALRHFHAGLRLKPGLAAGHYNLAIALEMQGKTDEAISHFREALHIDPEDADSHNNLGSALTRQDKFDEATRHFTEALRLNPDFADARKNLEMLALQKIAKPYYK
jgi:tetratricopeptide (TPR) repeat protein